MTGYGDVCEARTKKEMQARFSRMLSEIVKEHGGTKKGHTPLQLSNVGYVAGYYEKNVRDRVSRWLKAEHPVFGVKK